jgi:hypothetical protein
VTPRLSALLSSMCLWLWAPKTHPLAIVRLVLAPWLSSWYNISVMVGVEFHCWAAASDHQRWREGLLAHGHANKSYSTRYYILIALCLIYLLTLLALKMLIILHVHFLLLLDYYTPDMMGVKTDSEVMGDLVK